MSLETLLEAAKYLEYRSEAKARGEEPQDYPAFSRVNHHCPSSSGISNKHSFCRSPDLNRFDLIFDEVRDKRRVGGAGTREVHNKLEKNRRAHLKECFEMLKKQLPSMDERKTSNLSILRGALRYIQTLKRKEREYEHEMEKLAREKIASQQKLAALKKELSSHMDHVDIANFLPEQDNETTTTASECGAYSEDEEAATSRNQTAEIVRPGSPESVSQSSSSSSSNSNSEGPSMLDTIAMAAATLAHSTTVTPSAEQKNLHLPVAVVTSANVVTSNLPVAVVTNPPVTVTTTSTTANIISSLPAAQSTSSAVVGGPTLVASSLPQLVGTSSTQIKYPSNASTKAISFASASTSHIHLSTPVGATNSLQLGRMAGVLATPHGVQVINQASGGLKVLSPGSATLNGPLHILSPAASSLVAMASASTLQSSGSGTVVKQNQALVHVAASAGKNGPPGVTLVASPAVVSMAQMKNSNASKQVILQPGHVGSRSGSAKGPSTTLALVSAANGTTQVNGIAYGTTATKGTILTAPKSLHHSLVAGTSMTQATTTNVSSRQIVTSTIKPAQLRTASLPQFSGMAQIVSQSQLMSVSNHMGPLVAPVSVVSNSSSMIRASASLGKVLAGTPLLKNVSSLPLGAGLLQQPTTIFQPTNSVVKPMVVVSMAGSSTPGVVNIPISQ